jgi:hypothetical protein
VRRDFGALFRQAVASTLRAVASSAAASRRLRAGAISYLTADPTVKLGLTNWIDFEVEFNGYLNAATHSNLNGALISNGHGFGDTFFKTKFNIFGNDSRCSSPP